MRGRFYLFARFVRRFGAGRVVGVCALAVGMAGVPVAPAGAASALPSDLELIFPGGGWGHGHGMSQYGARAQAEAGRSWQQILHSYYRDVDVVDRGSETMRVLLASGGAVTVGGSEAYTAKWSNGTAILSRSSSYPYMRVRPTADGVALDKGSGPAGPWQQVTTGSLRIRFYPDGAVMPLVASSKGYLKYYRGFVEAYRRSSKTMYAINQLSMNKYLYGVVPRESPSYWHASALRTQAVAARSYSAWKKAHASSSAYHICATTWCQVYGGYGYRTSPGASMTKLERSSTNDAVKATSGMTMVSGGDPIFAEYHSSSGGHTSQGSRSYLAPVADPSDETYSPHYRWTARVTVAEVEARWPALGRLRGIAGVRRDGDGPWGGRVVSLTLVGTSADVTVSGNTFRSAFAWWPSTRADGIRSTLFGISIDSPAEPLDLVNGPDFNGDGRSDLAVGVPGAGRDAGAVNVLYGSTRGLTASGNQLFTQDTRGVRGRASAGDRFGAALATGDFDGDGRSDLAVGVPGDAGGAGAVNVLYGSARGLTASGNQLFTQDTTGIRGRAGRDDRFGFALAAGDLDGDGYDDLAVGAPDDAGGAGAVNVIYGTARGLTASGNQLFTQDTRGVRGKGRAGDGFGSALAIGDFNRNRSDDLAVGAPGDGGVGAVNVLYGSIRGLTASGNQLFTQDTRGVRGRAGRGDRFGAALAAGDFNGNGRMDLAVGVPGEDVNGRRDAGAVNVLYGVPGGLTVSGNQLFTQDTRGVRGRAGRGDRFGAALAAGDFNGNGRSDLAAGVPGEDVNGRRDAGAVSVLYGTARALGASGNQLFTQDTPSVAGKAGAGDAYGASLAMGDFNGNGRSDLAAGAPGEDVNGRRDAGAAGVLYGTASRITASGNRLFTRDTPGILGRAATGDRAGLL